jgi:hypothetical protein
MEIHAEYHKQHEQQEECIICLDDVETEWRELECHHRYHKKCIEDWITIRAKCPMCMKNIQDNKVDDINSHTEETHYISIRRFMLFILFVVCVIVVMVLCST